MTPGLIEKYERAQLGIDGNCGFALLGPNLQEGEAEFVEIQPVNEDRIPQTHHEHYTGEARSRCTLETQLAACRQALENLRVRLGLDHLPFYFDSSHPYGG